MYVIEISHWNYYWNDIHSLTFNIGDEDGTVKLWDARQKPNNGESGSYGKVMEAKPFEEFVSDIYFDANLGI